MAGGLRVGVAYVGYGLFGWQHYGWEQVQILQEIFLAQSPDLLMPQKMDSMFYDVESELCHMLAMAQKFLTASQ